MDVKDACWNIRDYTIIFWLVLIGDLKLVAKLGNELPSLYLFILNNAPHCPLLQNCNILRASS
jgi:hypothetical protein